MRVWKDGPKIQRDALCLGMACRQLWEVGWPYVQDAIFGPWCGTRLICEGDGNPPDDLPPNTLSTHEKEKFGAGDELYKNHNLGPVSLFHWMRKRGTLRWMFQLDGLQLSDLFNCPSCPLPEAERKQALQLIDRDNFVKFFSPEKYWTLRNLTKKALIRGKTLNAAFHSTPTTGLDLPSPDFGDVFVSQILWSKSSHSSVGLNRGNWAGHRFELLTDDDHDLTSDASWTSESEKVIQVLAKTLRVLGQSTSDDEIYRECEPNCKEKKRKAFIFRSLHPQRWANLGRNSRY